MITVLARTLCCVLLLACASCDIGSSKNVTVSNGDPRRGEAAIRQYGCPACHTIPGFAGSKANIGPPLERYATRMYIAGVLSNTPENLVRWIEDPPAVDPLTAMPNLGVAVPSARDMASYLYAN
jgi:cytochrome c2